MTSHKNIFKILILSASALAVTACSSMGYSNIMPSGYTYHHQEYKSATPAPSARINAEQRKYMDAAQAEQFRDAVYDLLTKVTMRGGMPPKPTYVLSPDPMTVFYANIDNDLRESMRTIGYAISDRPQGAYVFAYSAKGLNGAAAGQPNVELSLKIYDSIGVNAKLLTHETGQYYIQGIETLNIKPPLYSALPSDKNINVNKGHYQSTPEPFLSLATENPVLEEEKNIDNSSRVETYPPMREPTQGIVIDSSGVSYDAAPQDSSPFGSSVSKEVLY